MIDSAPPHYAVPFRQYLPQRFRGRRKGAIEYLHDFQIYHFWIFLIGLLKIQNLCNSTLPLEDWWQRIVNDYHQITPYDITQKSYHECQTEFLAVVAFDRHLENNDAISFYHLDNRESYSNF